MIKHLILLSLIVATLQIPNCKVTKQMCKTCKDGYVLVKLNQDETKCMENAKYDALVKNISNCAEFLQEELGTCKVCQRDFLVDGNHAECLNRTHCLHIDAEEKCDECFDPFLLNKLNGTCIENDLCLKLDNDKCKECRPHYYPDEKGVCIEIPIPHCKSYNDDQNCTKCDPWFYLDDDNHCAEYPVNCLDMDDTKKECKKCVDYYHPNGTICEKNPDNKCITMEENICTNCSGNFYPNDSHCVPYPDNCIEYNYLTKTCSKCNTSYDLDFENKCYPLPQNCKELEKITTTRKCGECKELYYLDINETCKEKPLNCMKVNNKTGKCEKCNDYYHLVGETCVSNPERCIEYNYENKKCKNCDENYYPDGKICKLKPEHCNIFDIPSKKCKECYYPYYEDEWTVCQPYPFKCRYLDNDNKCRDCEQYYYLDDDNNCVKKPEHCEKVNSTTGICEGCEHLYYLDENKTCQSNPNYCDSVNETTFQCYDCYSLYYLDTDYKCQPYPKNCSKVNETTDLCEACDNYYHLENNNCVDNKQFCITQDPESGNCTQCDKDHFVNEAKDCEENPPHCIHVNDTTQNCTACYGLFYPEGKECKGFPPHCISINIKTKECRKCNETTHYLFNGTCYELPQNCKKVDNKTITENCTKCNPYYHLDENEQCIDNNPHCIYMDDEERMNCTLCDGYYHPENDKCVENEDKHCFTMDETATNCTNCTGNYFPNGTHCEPYPEHCTSVNIITKKCQDCNDSYVLDDDKQCFLMPPNCKEVNRTTRKCKICNDLFYLDQDQNCQEKPSHCSSVNETTYNCSKCYRYYHLDNDFNCVQNPDHCYEIDEKTEECKCDSYYHPDGKSCKENLDHCQTIGSTSQKCRFCDDKYYLNNYVNCERLPDHCEKMNDTTKICERCEGGYHLEDGNCIENPAHCFYYNETSKECVNCTLYYYLKNKVCEPYPENCISYNETNNTCIKCYNYFYPVKEGCKRYPSYCIEYDIEQNKCTKCINTSYEFYLDEDGTCKANPAHCNGVDSKTGKCNSCASPYDFKNDLCINTCEEYEDICDNCIDNYGSFDYGKTCKAFIPEEVQKIYNLSIKSDFNLFEVNVGTNGIIYFATDYYDETKEIFNVSDIEDKTKFNTKIIDEGGQEYNADCRLYKLTSAKGQIAVLCELKTNLQKGSHKVGLKEAKVEYNGYTFFIKTENYINVKQFETVVPFLYYDSQTLNINKDNSFELNFKSNGYNDGDILFIKEGSSTSNYIILDNCNKNGENAVKCQLTKQKLESFTSYEHSLFNLGIINDKFGAYLFPFVSFIQINYEVEKKEGIEVTIKNLLTHEASINSAIAYETSVNINNIPELITAKFPIQFYGLEDVKCFFKKTKKTTTLLLICNIGGKIQESTYFKLEDYKYLNTIHPKYNFMINPVEINDMIKVQGSADPISLVYPENIDLSSVESTTVRFVKDLSSDRPLPKYIKLNDKSYTTLECEDLINMKKCEVPLSHFEEQKSGEFYSHQYLDTMCPVFYDTNSINITLPDLVTLKIEKKDNLDTTKIGQKGVIYLITDYNDDDKFPQSSLPDLKFTGNFNDVDGNNTYTSECKLWRLDSENKNIRILCKLNENLNKENQEIYLKQTSFMNGKLGVISYILKNKS